MIRYGSASTDWCVGHWHSLGRWRITSEQSGISYATTTLRELQHYLFTLSVGWHWVPLEKGQEHIRGGDVIRPRTEESGEYFFATGPLVAHSLNGAQCDLGTISTN
jgi:hypothetical protein